MSFIICMEMYVADEQMRKWIDIVSRAQDGEVRSSVEFGTWWSKLVAALVAIAVIVAGVEAGRSFGCHVGWFSSSRCKADPASP